MSLKNKWYMQPEMMVGFSALVVSLVAVIVSLYSASIDRDFARASLWPRVDIARSFSNQNYQYVLLNNGTGPALLKYAKVGYKGRYYSTWYELLSANGYPLQTFSQSHISTIVLPANNKTEAIKTKDTKLIDGLTKLDDELTIEICYCSVYDECWIATRSEKSSPVNQCSIDENVMFRQ